MRVQAGRLKSTSAVVACAVFFGVLLLSACSPDSPGAVDPVTAGQSFEVLDLSHGSVIAEIKSAWAPSKCISVRDAAMTDGSLAELQPCAGETSQKFEFLSTGEIRIGSAFCLDASGAMGERGDPVVIWRCHGGVNQKWTLTSDGEIRGINDLCVSFAGHPDNGASLYISTCRERLGQTWIASATSSPDPTPTTPTTPTPAPVASVSVSLSVSSIGIGQIAQASATTKDDDGNTLTNRTVSWTSSSPLVATITAAGLITAIAPGTTNIVGTSEGKSGSAVVTVTAPTVPAPPSGGACGLVKGTTARATSALGKPGYLQPVIDPDFGTTITRITGDPGTPIGGGVSGTWPNVAYHNYSKDPVWTADQRLIVLKHMSGGPALFLDGSTYQPLFTRSGPANGGGEWRLHPTLPDIAVALGTNGSVSHWNVRTNVTTTKVPAAAGYTSNELGPYEGNVSYDGRYLVAKATRSSDGHTVARVFDVDGGTEVSVIDISAAGSLDWVSISALGGYVVAYGNDQRTRIWTRDGSFVSAWLDFTFGHYDLGVDQAGAEVAFGAASNGTYGKRFLTRRLSDGAVTVLSPTTSYNWHAGTRATLRQGWGFAATNDRLGSVLDGEIYGFKLDGSNTIERWAHHRASNASYDRSAFPTASPDGKRIVFASDWLQTSGPLQAYVVDARPICP